MDLQISARESGNVTILDLRGRIVIGASNDSFGAEIRKLANNVPCNILLNVAEVTQMDSSGISTLVKSFVALKRNGGALKILNPKGRVSEVLDVTGLVKCLPIFTDELTALANFRNASPSDAAVSAQQTTVLLVDPDREVDELITQVATDEGWDLQRAPDNRTALLIAENSPFDLIITGQKTSGHEDIDLLRKIRNVRPHVRMIILTARTTPGDVIEALRNNAFSYFSAPFDRVLLAEMVHQAILEPYWDDGIEVISATPNWIRLTARCTIATADRLIQFLRQADLPQAEKEDLAAAAHEILLNAMEHGGKFDPNQYVEIGYLRTARAVTCRVKDPGQGFSLEELRHAAVGNSPGDLLSHTDVREKQGLRAGGFGILLAKKFVDEVIYGERGNDVILIKYLDPAGRPKA